jgi:hypothetical protein
LVLLLILQSRGGGGVVYKNNIMLSDEFLMRRVEVLLIKRVTSKRKAELYLYDRFREMT